MGRKKRVYLSDDDSSEVSEGDEEGYEERNPYGNDADENAERELFEDPYQRRQSKRRRLNKKDDATYGVFGEDDDDGPVYAREKAGRRKARYEPLVTAIFGNVSNYVHRTPTFQRASVTSAAKPRQDQDMEEARSEPDSDDDDESSSDEEDIKPAPVRHKTQDSDGDESEEDIPMQVDQEEEQEEEEEQPRMGLGGIGSKGGIGSSGSGGIGSGSRGGIGSSGRGGIGSGGRGGIGSSSTSGIGASRAAPTFTSRPGLGTGNTTRAPMFTSSKTLDPASLTEAHDRDVVEAHADPPRPPGANTPGSSAAATPPPSTPTPSGLPTPSNAPSRGSTNLPTAFGATRAQRAFVRNDPTRSDSAAPTPVILSHDERQHFASISNSFGAKLMEKMGWKAVSSLPFTLGSSH
jgi:tuftelin-interacting protein 11